MVENNISFKKIFEKYWDSLIIGIISGLVVYYGLKINSGFISAVYIFIFAILLNTIYSFFAWIDKKHCKCFKNYIGIEVNKFKELIKEMLRGYPNYVYYGLVEKVINKSVIKDLLKNKFLTKGKTILEGKEVPGYSLGVNALPIVSAWETEELTRKIKWLTIIVIAIAIISVVIQIISINK